MRDDISMLPRKVALKVGLPRERSGRETRELCWVVISF